MRLSDKQRDMVAQNHGLIYSFLKKHNFDESDYYDLAAIGLCKAAIKYDSDKGAFATLAYSVMLNEVLMDKRKDRALKRKCTMIKWCDIENILSSEYDPDKMFCE